MVYKIVVVTRPLKNKADAQDFLTEFKDLAIFRRCKVIAHSEDGPQPFAVPLKGYKNGHRFTFLIDKISEANLSLFIKFLNDNYLSASAARM